MADIIHNKDHDIDSTADHDGVSGATEDNLISFNANGLPKDSNIASVNVSSGQVTVTIIGANGGAITTGALKVYQRVPYGGTITGYEMVADQAGSIVLDIWNDTYANFPPTVADTITAAAKPTISGAQKATDTTLTGWTKTITAGDYLGFNVDSAATITVLVFHLFITKG